MKVYSRHQGGWIAKFVIIGVALLLTLLLGVYFLKSQAKTSQTQVDHPTSDTKGSEDKSSSNSGSSNDKNSVDKALPSTSGNNDQSTNSSGNSNSSSTSSDATVGTLPHTGPETTAAQFVAIATLVFVVTLYIRSRRVA